LLRAQGKEAALAGGLVSIDACRNGHTAALQSAQSALQAAFSAQDALNSS